MNSLIFVYIVALLLTVQSLPVIRSTVSWGGAFIIVFLVFIRMALNKLSFRLPDNLLSLFIFLYISWLTICTSASSYLGDSLIYLLRFVGFFTVVLIFFNWIDSWKKTNVIVSAILTASVIASLSVLVQLAALEGGLLEKENFMRLTGFFYTGPNALGLHLSLAIPMVLSFCLFSKGKKKIYLYLILTLLLSALFFSFSRSSWLSVLISSSIILSFHKSGRRIFLFLLCLFLISMFSLRSRSFLYTLLRLERRLTFRSLLWNSAINMIKHEPLFGFGPGSFKHLVFPFSHRLISEYPIIEWGGIIGADAHNLFLTKGAEMGIPGIVLVTFLFAISLRLFLKMLKIKLIGSQKAIIYGAAAAIVATLVRSFFEGMGMLSRGGLGYDLLFWLYLIFLIKAPTFNKEVV